MLQPSEPPPETPPSSKKAKWRKLETIAHVRMALACVIKRVYDGKMDAVGGAVCINGLRVLAKTIYDADIDRRLRALEESRVAPELHPVN